MTLIASSIIDGKYWIIYNNSHKIGTVRDVDGKLMFHISGEGESQISAEEFLTMEIVSTKDKEVVEVQQSCDVFGWMGRGSQAFNKKYTEDGIPVFTTTLRGKGVYAAGFYAVYFPTIKWTHCYSPKLTTLTSHTYEGPFKSDDDLQIVLKRKRQEERR